MLFSSFSSCLLLHFTHPKLFFCILSLFPVSMWSHCQLSSWNSLFHSRHILHLSMTFGSKTSLQEKGWKLFWEGFCSKQKQTILLLLSLLLSSNQFILFSSSICQWCSDTVHECWWYLFLFIFLLYFHNLLYKSI